MDPKKAKSEIKFREVCIFYTKRMIKDDNPAVLNKTMKNQLLRFEVEIDELKKLTKRGRK